MVFYLPKEGKKRHGKVCALSRKSTKDLVTDDNDLWYNLAINILNDNVKE